MDKVPKDLNTYPKGFLDLWGVDEPGYEGFNISGNGMGKNNHKLWGYFEKKNPGKEQEQITQEMFNRWYETQTSDTQEQSTIKNFLK